jgi:hypothetical protein|tara:strand:+ start:735 stop:908 length:174 start_codon:yes stop_codon:yes gene_type:complete
MIYHPNIDDETLFRIQEREYALMMERFYEQMEEELTDDDDDDSWFTDPMSKASYHHY